MSHPTALLKRFWSKVDKKTTDGCWNWTGALKKGYGRFRMGGISEPQIPAHRAAYILKHGEISQELLVRHKCDNRRCVRPSHLALGTAKQNTGDAIARGRLAKGEKIPWSKLTEANVLEIRNSSETQKSLAARFGVCRTNISLVKRRKNWRHVS